MTEYVEKDFHSLSLIGTDSFLRKRHSAGAGKAAYCCRYGAYLPAGRQSFGEGSAYRDAFAGGTLTHTFLDVNDYHRYHAPVSGVLREFRNIPGVAA